MNLVAPAFMRQSARRGLRLHEEGFSGDGLKPQTVADARKMAEGVALSEDKWRRIAPWIARHTSDLSAVDGDEITPGLVAMLLWGGGSSKESARRAQGYAERIVAQLDAAEERAPAPKKDQIKGSDKNPAGSAEGKKGGITISAETETALRNKLDEHNDKMKDRPAWTRTTMGALKAVYRRGAGAFSTSHRPGMARNQWAMARVNAFLVLCRTGRPNNPKYVTDNDLLHKSHPKYSGKRYDPDQPRDDDGKFGEGGGGGGDGDGGKKNTIGTNESEVEIDPDIEDIAGSEEYSQIADGVLADEQGEYGDGLVPAQREALDYYTGVGHRPINKTLRGAPPPPPPPEVVERSRAEAERINGAIRAAPALEQGVIVYRGIGDAAEMRFNDAPVGATFVDKGIVSTSLSIDTAQGFSGVDKSDVPSTLLEIRVPSGSNALSVSAFKGREWMERELMLPSETEFTVVGKKKLETGQIVVIVDANTGN